VVAPGPIRWIALGVAVVVIGGDAVIYWQSTGAEHAVATYFEALAKHDAETAWAMADIAPGGDAKDMTATIPPAAVRAADYQPPSLVEIVGSFRERRRTFVDVRFRLGDLVKSTRLELKSDSGKWRILGGVGVLAVTVPGAQSAWVNGVDVPTDKQGYKVAKALPGLYRVDVPNNPLTEADPVTVTVLLNERGYANTKRLELRVKPGAIDHINQLVRQFLDRCAEQKVSSPVGCPFKIGSIGNLAVPYGTVIGDARWSIAEYPQVDVKISNPTQVQVFLRGNGRAIVTMQRSFQGQTNTFTETVRFGGLGWVTASGDQLSWKAQT